MSADLLALAEPMPFVCRHADPRCEEDPCPRGIARFLCNAPADHPVRALSVLPSSLLEGR